MTPRSYFFVAVVAFLVTCSRAHATSYYGLQLSLWLLAVATFAKAVDLRWPQHKWPETPKAGLPEVFLAGGTVVLLAYGLDVLPFTVSREEAKVGLLAQAYLAPDPTPRFPLLTRLPFLPHPSLPFALDALFVQVFGNHLWVLRATSAVAGAIAAGSFFLWSRRVFGRLAALFATLLLVTHPFFVHYARVGFPTQQAVAALFVALAFAETALRTERRSRFVLAGFAAGFASLGAWAGLAVVPVLLVRYAIAFFAQGPSVVRRAMGWTAMGLLVALAPARVAVSFGSLWENPGSFQFFPTHSLWAFVGGGVVAALVAQRLRRRVVMVLTTAGVLVTGAVHLHRYFGVYTKTNPGSVSDVVVRIAARLPQVCSVEIDPELPHVDLQQESFQLLAPHVYRCASAQRNAGPVLLVARAEVPVPSEATSRGVEHHEGIEDLVWWTEAGPAAVPQRNLSSE